MSASSHGLRSGRPVPAGDAVLRPFLDAYARTGAIALVGAARRIPPAHPEEVPTHMQVTTGIDTAKGPDSWFTGDVYLDAVAPAPPGRVQANLVHFTPGARTRWHRHPLGQTVYVTEGVGLCQARGGPIEVIRPGDRVRFEPGEEHWHGAAPARFMAHLALNEVDEAHVAAEWGDEVTDHEYRAAPEVS